MWEGLGRRSFPPVVIMFFVVPVVTATTCDQLQCQNGNPCQSITRDNTTHAQCVCTGKWAGPLCQHQLHLSTDVLTSSKVTFGISLVKSRHDVARTLTSQETALSLVSSPKKKTKLSYTLVYWRNNINVSSDFPKVDSLSVILERFSCVLLQRQSSERPVLHDLFPNCSYTVCVESGFVDSCVLSSLADYSSSSQQTDTSLTSSWPTNCVTFFTYGEMMTTELETDSDELTKVVVCVVVFLVLVVLVVIFLIRRYSVGGRLLMDSAFHKCLCWQSENCCSDGNLNRSYLTRSASMSLFSTRTSRLRKRIEAKWMKFKEKRRNSSVLTPNMHENSSSCPPDVFDNLESSEDFDDLESSDMFDTLESPEIFNHFESPEVLNCLVSPEVMNYLDSPELHNKFDSREAFESFKSPKDFDISDSSEVFNHLQSTEGFETFESHERFKSFRSPENFDASKSPDVFSTFESRELFEHFQTPETLDDSQSLEMSHTSAFSLHESEETPSMDFFSESPHFLMDSNPNKNVQTSAWSHFLHESNPNHNSESSHFLHESNPNHNSELTHFLHESNPNHNSELTHFLHESNPSELESRPAQGVGTASVQFEEENSRAGMDYTANRKPRYKRPRRRKRRGVVIYNARGLVRQIPLTPVLEECSNEDEDCDDDLL